MHLAKLMTVLSVCILVCGSPLCFFSVSSNAIAQPPNSIEADRPTQRWLPLPQGDATDLSEQAQLLQQLRNLISSESQDGASEGQLPKLSEEQLREMEKALESMRDLIGEDKLPNLESIPKEWIDQALSDPVLRKQAQQLLEQYARDRKLPLPSDRSPRNSDGAPFPRRQPSDKSSQNPKSNSKTPQNSRSNTPPKSPSTSSQNPRELFPPVEDPFSNKSDPNATEPSGSGRTSQSPGGAEPGGAKPRGAEPSGKAPNATRSGGEPSQGTEDQQDQSEGIRSRTSDSGKAKPTATPSPDRPLPTRPDAERIEALQELFKKLKTIEGQRTPAGNLPNRNPGSTNSNSPSQPGPNSSNNLRSTKPNPPRNQSNSAMPPRVRSGTQPLQPPQDSSNQFAPSSSSDSTAESTIGAGGSDPTSYPPMVPRNLDKPTSNDSALDKGSQSKSRFSDVEKKMLDEARTRIKQQSSAPPGSNGQKAGLNGGRDNSSDRTANMPIGRSGDANSPAGSGSVMQDADLKTQLERHGLGRALKSIVEKTMKEQGESNSATNQPTGKSSSAQSKSKDMLANNKSQSTTLPPTPPSSTASRPTPKNADSIARNNGPAAAPSVQSSNQNANSPSMMSGWRDTASQFWGAIRSTPGERSGGSSSSTPSISGGFGDFGFALNGRALLVLGLVLVLCVLLLLLARKRIVLATAAKEAEAELAKEILTEGIRTRADVVRAFHRFVLRRAQPVANWWNHRYVAAKLSDASPQLRSVISDLASVYEHARYLPPEVKLSSEEIDRVQAALKQCAASGA